MSPVADSTLGKTPTRNQNFLAPGKKRQITGGFARVTSGTSPFPDALGIIPTAQWSAGPIAVGLGPFEFNGMALFPELQVSQADGPDSSLVCDETLMRKITQRQQHALRELHSRYARSLRALIGSVVHEESEADDVLQESFLQIWREAHHYSPKAGKPLGWVITIARRRAIDRVRRRDSYRRAKQRFEDESKPQAHTGGATTTAAEVVQSDLRRFLGRQMRTLPRDQREAVELAYFRGLSQREIAATTHTPLGTVKTRIQLGLRKLTQCVRPLRHKI
jgi:RNA polymerase sigma-70 factor (ECF subfamily)